MHPYDIPDCRIPDPYSLASLGANGRLPHFSLAQLAARDLKSVYVLAFAIVCWAARIIRWYLMKPLFPNVPAHIARVTLEDLAERNRSRACGQ